MHSSNFLSTCIPNAVVNYLLFQSLFFGKLRSITIHTMAGLMYVRSEVWDCQRSAGERHRLLGCTLWKLTKLEPNIQCTRLPMQSTGKCTLVVWRGVLPIEIVRLSAAPRKEEDGYAWCYDELYFVWFCYLAHSGHWHMNSW